MSEWVGATKYREREGETQNLTYIDYLLSTNDPAFKWVAAGSEIKKKIFWKKRRKKNQHKQFQFDATTSRKNSAVEISSKELFFKSESTLRNNETLETKKTQRQQETS